MDEGLVGPVGAAGVGEVEVVGAPGAAEDWVGRRVVPCAPAVEEGGEEVEDYGFGLGVGRGRRKRRRAGHAWGGGGEDWVWEGEGWWGSVCRWKWEMVVR